MKISLILTILLIGQQTSEIIGSVYQRKGCDFSLTSHPPFFMVSEDVMDSGKAFRDKLFKEVPNYPNYHINRLGILVCTTYGKTRKIKVSMHNDYLRYGLYNRKRKRMDSQYVHTLLLNTFVRPKKTGEQCRHLDGNKLNNNLSNLKWGTYEENFADRWLHDEHPIGVRVGISKLNDVAVKVLRYLYKKKGIDSVVLGKAYKMAPNNIRHAIAGRTWKHVRYGLDHWEANCT